ncbi:hypothetical protein [Paenibacillus gorillae]|uniref:hypothetical protein n=1 Tax=Paenibacillus gorillae TaxID=1243662 RepID=UPI0004AEA95D|nr:hypothetical protein [Paenibacillus gorillae]
MNDGDNAEEERKTFYVSVQAGQVLTDQEAAAYELVITASEEEADQLKQLFSDLSSMDEAQTSHFLQVAIAMNDDSIMNGGYDDILRQIYRFLYERGTDETKHVIEGMGIL